MKRILSLVLSLVIILSMVCVAAPSVSAASAMTTSTAGVNMIKGFEGFEEWPYKDGDLWYVGYGSQVSGADLAKYRANGITEAEAVELLAEYLETFEAEVNEFIDEHNLKLSQNQFDALISFTYNLGYGWMSDDESVFRAAVINGTIGNDFIFAMAQFGKANGQVIGGLVKRRLCEVNLYLNGVYSNQPPVNYKYVTFDANLSGAVVYIKSSPDNAVSIQGYDTSKTAAVKAAASKSGYRFMGWYTEEDGGTNITTLGLNTAGISTLYARWQNGDGELNEDGSIKGMAVEYSGYVRADGAHEVYDAPGGEQIDTVDGADKLNIVAEYMDSEGAKWGKLSTGGWIDVSEGLEQAPVYEDAESLIDPITVTVTSNNVNNRVGPGTKYAKQGKYVKGQQLTLTAVQKGGNYKWGKSESGWIALQYTDYETASILDSEDAKKVTAIGTIIKADVLNVRSGPGTHNARVATYNRGDQVKITLRQKVGNTTWGLTEKGWISLYYAKVTEVEEGEVPDIDVSGGTSGDSTTSGGSTNTGSSESTVVRTGKIVNCNTLRIRSGAGTSNAHIGNYSKGTYVNIYETVTVRSDTWGRTEQGWICLRYVQLDAPTTGEGVTGRVYRCTTLNVRAGAGTYFAKVGKLASGAKVEILEYTKVGNATWGRTVDGWVSLYYIDLDAPITDLDNKNEAATGTSTGTGIGTGTEPTATEPTATEPQATNYTVTISNATNGKVTASASSAAKDAEVTLTVTPDAGYVLDTLVVKNASGAAVTVTNNKFTMPASNVTITATFKAQYDVKINSATNGKVTANTTACAPGSEVVLTVAPNAGYELDALTVLNTATNTSVSVSGGKFTMPAGDVNVVATFKKATAKTYEVKVNNATNGKVSASTTSAKEADTVTLTVNPADGYVLDTLTVKDASNTSVTCKAVAGKENTYSFKMPKANVTIAASFKVAMYTVSITNSTPNAGTVSVNPEKYEKGATVTLVVAPASAQHEVKTLTVKAGDTVIETKKDGANYKFTMPAEDVSVETTFGKIRYALTIAETTGGTVTADKETYAMNETVTVTIRPDTGYSRGTMVIKNGSEEIEPTRSGLVYTFKMPNAAVNVKHTFTKNAYTLNIKNSSYGVITADKETYGYQDVVTLSVKPKEGYVLKAIAVKNGSTKLELKQEGDNYTFVMPVPADEVVVSATYMEAPAKYEVTYSGGDYVNIRETPSSLGKDLGDIPNGTILEALEGSTESWIKVKYNDITGWVATSNLTKVTD